MLSAVAPVIGIALLLAQAGAAPQPTVGADPATMIPRPQPVAETPVEALVQDGIQYTKLHDVALIEAVRRLVAQEASVPQIDALALLSV